MTEETKTPLEGGGVMSSSPAVAAAPCGATEAQSDLDFAGPFYFSDCHHFLQLILPLARGYAAAHRVGSNAEYVREAQEYADAVRFFQYDNPGRDAVLSSEEQRQSPSEASAGNAGLDEQLSLSQARQRELEEALREARDLLLERKQGSPARSAGHNARLVIEAALRAAPSPTGGER